MPFTAPQLLGARLRQGKRGGIEAVIPNPSGGRGTYILDWYDVRQVLRPTMHDMAIHQFLGAAQEIGPDTVQIAARRAAREGLAGRAAREAAEIADRADADDRVLATFLLTMCLLEQSEPSGLTISESMPRTPALEEKARAVVARAWPETGTNPKRIVETIEALARNFAPIGIDPRGSRPRLPRLLSRIDSLRAELESFPSEVPAERGLASASVVAKAASRFVRDAWVLMQECRTLTADVAQLVELWTRRPEQVLTVLSRPGWLLDGWDQICLLWETATTPALRHAALMDMRRMLPHLPTELDAWLPGRPLQEESMPCPVAIPPADASPSLGTLLALTARAERMRGLPI